jgi:hypothetical protein
LFQPKTGRLMYMAMCRCYREICRRCKWDHIR